MLQNLVICVKVQWDKKAGVLRRIQSRNSLQISIPTKILYYAGNESIKRKSTWK